MNPQPPSRIVAHTTAALAFEYARHLYNAFALAPTDESATALWQLYDTAIEAAKALLAAEQG